MRQIHLADTDAEKEFVLEAAKVFQKNPNIISYSYHAQPREGELLALRWGLGNDCVLVLQVDPCYEPAIYENIIPQEKP